MRSESRTRSIVIWTTVSLVGVVAWGVIALIRDEQIPGAWLIAAALGSYAIAGLEPARAAARARDGDDRDRRDAALMA